MSKVLLSALIRKQRRDRAKDDLFYFAKYYLPHFLKKESPDFHKEIIRLLQTEKRVGIAAPRGFAKSTLVQIVYGLHCLLFNEEEDILSISQSSTLAEDWIRKLKFELEGNERIRDDFGPILQWGDKQSKRWTSEHIVIQKDGRVFSQIRARGRGCQVRGLRPTKVFADDLEDDELVRNEDQRKILKDWFLTALLNVLKIDQQLVVIGTILHPLSLLRDLIDKKEQFEYWTTRKYKALMGNKSLWAERFPVEDLKRRRFEIGTLNFEKEFQNNPISSDICLWRPHWLKKYETLPKNIKTIFAALDPAATAKESSDHSSMTAMGVTTDDKIYELDTIKGRWGTWDLIDQIIKFYLKYKPIRFGIEEIAFQNIIQPVLIREASKHGIRIPIEAITLGKYTGKEKGRREAKDKYTRALSVVHYWEQGIVYVKTPDLIEQLEMFPTGGEDDCVDSCVWCMKMIMKYNPIKIMVNNPTKQTFSGFEVDTEKQTIPCFTSIDDIFKRPTGDWKIGG